MTDTDTPKKSRFGFLRFLVLLAAFLVVGVVALGAFSKLGLGNLGSNPLTGGRAADPVAPARVYAIPGVALLPSATVEARARDALSRGRPEEARRLIESALGQAVEPSLGRLRFLLAKTTPDIQVARQHLEVLAASNHLLSGWARLRLTERLLDVDPQAAAESAFILLGEPRFRSRAEQLLALGLYGANKPDEAEPLLRSLVADGSQRSANANLAMPLASILARKPDLDSQRYAFTLYRRVYTRAPLGDKAQEAKRAADELLAHMPQVQRVALANLSVDDAFAEAEALVKAHEYARAVERYGAIAQRFRGDPQSVCDARLGQGKALFAANKRSEALTVFEDVVRLCQTANHRAEAHFQAGKVLLRRGDPQGAVAHYDAVAHDFPQHKLADEALKAAAVAFHDLEDVERERTYLRRLITQYKRSALRPDARFALGWLERSQGRLDAALAEFDALIEEGPGEQTPDSVGRAEYWRAVTLSELNRRDDAEAAWLSLWRRRPLSYYGQLSLMRIRELDMPLANQLVSELRDVPPSRRGRASDVRLPPQPEMQSVEYQRAIELLHVGEPIAAVEELEAAGCFRQSAQDDLYMLCAALLSEFGAEGQATAIARRRGARVLSQEPRGQNIAVWRVVYPRAYSELLDDVAKKADVPVAFVRALAREESSFDPKAVSPASAYGLTQVIRSTARTYANALHLPSDVESLKDPEINLRIGSAYLHALFDRFNHNMAVVPAAYNAGPNIADKWLRDRDKLGLDEWVETIPYNETRFYTRRVLQSYGVYAWLDEGRVPHLSRQLFVVKKSEADAPRSAQQSSPVSPSGPSAALPNERRSPSDPRPSEPPKIAIPAPPPRSSDPFDKYYPPFNDRIPERDQGKERKPPKGLPADPFDHAPPPSISQSDEAWIQQVKDRNQRLRER